MSQDNKEKILVTAADLADEAKELLNSYELVFTGRTTDYEHIASLIKEHQPVAVIVRYSGVNKAALEQAKALRVISKHGSGVDSIDLEAAQAHGIEVRAASGVNANAVAEHAFALILACSKSIVVLNERMQAGHWDKPTHQSIELAGKTLGLVGVGAIGQRVAEMAKAFNMSVIAYDPAPQNSSGDIESVELDEIWRRADVISLHCPLTSQTRNLINKETLKKMKAGVTIINTARGAVINETDTIHMLKAGQVGALGLDTFAVEPLPPESPLRHVPNVILSPHIGGVTQEAYIAMGVAAAKNVLSVLASEPIPT